MGKVAWEAVIKAGCFDETGHNRGAVLAALDVALKDASAAAADRRAAKRRCSTHSAARTPAGPEQKNDGIDDSKALSKGDTLALEFEVLGFYLSGHPLEEQAGLVSLLSSSPIPELAGLEGGTEVRLAGLVLQKSELVVKSGRMAGQKMCRLRLEDLHGSIPVTVFPRTYAECKDMIEDGAVLFVQAKLEDSGEEPALILEAALPIHKALSLFQGGLSIALSSEDEGLLERLQGTVGRHRGERQLFFQVTGRDGHTRRVQAGRDYRVAISEELVQEMDELLGAGRIGLVRV